MELELEYDSAVLDSITSEELCLKLELCTVLELSALCTALEEAAEWLGVKLGEAETEVNPIDEWIDDDTGDCREAAELELDNAFCVLEYTWVFDGETNFELEDIEELASWLCDNWLDNGPGTLELKRPWELDESSGEGDGEPDESNPAEDDDINPADDKDIDRLDGETKLVPLELATNCEDNGIPEALVAPLDEGYIDPEPYIRDGVPEGMPIDDDG